MHVLHEGEKKKGKRLVKVRRLVHFLTRVSFVLPFRSARPTSKKRNNKKKKGKMTQLPKKKITKKKKKGQNKEKEMKKKGHVSFLFQIIVFTVWKTTTQEDSGVFRLVG